MREYMANMEARLFAVTKGLHDAQDIERKLGHAGRPEGSAERRNRGIPMTTVIRMSMAFAIMIGTLAGAQAAAADSCLEPIYTKGMLGTGYWENSCSTGWNVSWNLENDAGTCRAQPYSEFPCATFVPAHSKVTATMAGSVTWIECEAETTVSGPFPFATDDGRYECRDLQDKAYARSGSGVLWNENGAVYMGQIRNSLPHGFGMVSSPKQGRYIGYWRRGRMHGEGTHTYPDGDSYQGQWNDHDRMGDTVLTVARRRLEEQRERDGKYYEEALRRAEREIEAEEAESRSRRRGNALDLFNTILGGLVESKRRSRAINECEYSGTCSSAPQSTKGFCMDLNGRLIPGCK